MIHDWFYLFPKVDSTNSFESKHVCMWITIRGRALLSYQHLSPTVRAASLLLNGDVIILYTQCLKSKALSNLTALVQMTLSCWSGTEGSITWVLAWVNSQQQAVLLLKQDTPDGSLTAKQRKCVKPRNTFLKKLLPDIPDFLLPSNVFSLLLGDSEANPG